MGSTEVEDHTESSWQNDPRIVIARTVEGLQTIDSVLDEKRRQVLAKRGQGLSKNGEMGKYLVLEVALSDRQRARQPVYRRVFLRGFEGHYRDHHDVAHGFLADVWTSVLDYFDTLPGSWPLNNKPGAGSYYASDCCVIHGSGIRLNIRHKGGGSYTAGEDGLTVRGRSRLFGAVSEEDYCPRSNISR